MTKIELLGLPKKDIANMCKEAGLPRYKGKSELTKEEMIDNLLANVEFVEESYTGDDAIVVKQEEDKPVGIEEKVEDPVSVEENVEEPEPWIMKDRSDLIEKAEVGTLIAFYDEKGKPRTAALVNRSSKKKVVKLVTEFEREFIVPYDNVIWIKKGNRWPRGVYNLLKGYKTNGVKETENK